MNAQELLEWICAIVLLGVTGTAIAFVWVKAIDLYLALINRLQSTVRERA
ncbi:hypothetical protein [Paraburkholderia sp.]